MENCIKPTWKKFPDGLAYPNNSRFISVPPRLSICYIIK
jgi:hypothetical protein